MLFGPVAEGKRIAATPRAALVGCICGSRSSSRSGAERVQYAALRRLPSSRLFGDAGPGTLLASGGELGILRTEHSLVGAPFLLLLVPPMPLVLIDPQLGTPTSQPPFVSSVQNRELSPSTCCLLDPTGLTPSGTIMVGDTSWEVQNRALTQLEMEKC